MPTSFSDASPVPKTEHLGQIAAQIEIPDEFHSEQLVDAVCFNLRVHVPSLCVYTT